jgi:hypothetical protein
MSLCRPLHVGIFSCIRLPRLHLLHRFVRIRKSQLYSYSKEQVEDTTLCDYQIPQRNKPETAVATRPQVLLETTQTRFRRRRKPKQLV